MTLESSQYGLFGWSGVLRRCEWERLVELLQCGKRHSITWNMSDFTEWHEWIFGWFKPANALSFF